MGRRLLFVVYEAGTNVNTNVVPILSMMCSEIAARFGSLKSCLQEQTLLRVQSECLTRAHREEGVIKGIDVLNEVTVKFTTFNPLSILGSTVAAVYVNARLGHFHHG